MIAVVDYGIGNVRSVLNALSYIGVDAVLTRDLKILAESAGIILPGVGAFGEGMRRLNACKLPELLIAQMHSGKPLLGICLGFQMLMRSSAEQGWNEGLALFDQKVVKLPVDARLPHIGWSRVSTAANSLAPPRLLEGLDGELFYFIHSYGVIAPIPLSVMGVSVYAGCEIAALLECRNIFGVQFHPEKSGEAGLQVLRNFQKFCE